MSISYRCALCNTPCVPIPDNRDVNAADFICDGCWSWITSNAWSWEHWENTLLVSRINLHVAVLNTQRAVCDGVRPVAKIMRRLLNELTEIAAANRPEDVTR